MGINYNYDSKNETAEQYHARIAKARGELSGDNATKSESTVNPAEGMTNFNIGINKAIDEARKMRQDKTMDFMNGVVPPGALPASSFASVLKQFNSSSAPMEATLMEGAMDFAKEQEKIKVDTQNQIKDLALKVMEHGGSPDVVKSINALVASGDFAAAMTIAGTVLGDSSKDRQQIGSSYVEFDKDGNARVLYSAPKSERERTPTQIENDEEEAAKVSVEADLRAEVGPADGKTNPFTYNQKYQEIVVEGGMPEAQFFKDFPPDKWLRYEDPNIDSRVRVFMKKPEKADKVETLEERQERLLDNG